jgi:hypothetical protein
MARAPGLKWGLNPFSSPSICSQQREAPNHNQCLVTKSSAVHLNSATQEWPVTALIISGQHHHRLDDMTCHALAT